MTLDHPHVRRDEFCPLCIGRKGDGLLACWPCYKAHGLRYGNAKAEATIAERERQLIRNWRADQC